MQVIDNSTSLFPGRTMHKITFTAVSLPYSHCILEVVGFQPPPPPIASPAVYANCDVKKTQARRAKIACYLAVYVHHLNLADTTIVAR